MFREKFVAICLSFIQKFVSLINMFGYILISARIIFHGSRFFVSSCKGRYGYSVIMIIPSPFFSL